MGNEKTGKSEKSWNDEDEALTRNVDQKRKHILNILTKTFLKAWFFAVEAFNKFTKPLT
jgi:hypothetical protein